MLLYAFQMPHLPITIQEPQPWLPEVSYVNNGFLFILI
jgi:hypothetical protein